MIVFFFPFLLVSVLKLLRYVFELIIIMLCIIIYGSCCRHLFLNCFGQDLTNQARALENRLSEIHKRLRWMPGNIWLCGVRLFGFVNIYCKILILWLVTFLTSFILFWVCSYWINPDKINTVEDLGQMEDSLRESLNQIRTHKVCL